MKIFPMQLPMHTVDGGINERIKLSSTIIQTKNLLMIVDTGWTHFPNDMLNELKKYNLEPKKFDLVLNTHVHPDHVGNNFLFENARLIMSRVDFEFAKNYSTEMIASENPAQTFQKYYPEYELRQAEKHAAYSKKLTARYWDESVAGNSKKIEWIEDSPELPEFISFINTPGHTPGHYAIKLQGEKETIFFTGDALPAKIFWKRKLRELAPRWNYEAFEKSKKLVEQFEGIIIGGHDRPFYSRDKKYIDGSRFSL